MVFTVKLESNEIKNAMRRLLAGERHETVQPLVLLSPRPEHFNLDAKSESLPAMSHPRWDLGGRGQTSPTLRTYKTQPGWSRRSAYGTHIKSVAEFSESWSAEIVKMGAT